MQFIPAELGADGHDDDLFEARILRAGAGPSLLGLSVALDHPENVLNPFGAEDWLFLLFLVQLFVIAERSVLPPSVLDRSRVAST